MQEDRTRTRDGNSTKPEKVKIKLDYPIEVGGSKIGEITMRRPKVRDRMIVEELTGSEATKEVRMIANLTGLAPEELDDLDLSDYLKIQKAMMGFIDAQLPRSVGSSS